MRNTTQQRVKHHDSNTLPARSWGMDAEYGLRNLLHENAALGFSQSHQHNTKVMPYPAAFAGCVDIGGMFTIILVTGR